MSKPVRSMNMGVRGRLMLAFLGVCMFSLVAAASGYYSLSQVGGALKEITEQRVPEVLSWLKLSQGVERVVRAAPTLLAVETESARAEVSSEISAQIKKLAPLLQGDRNYSTHSEKFAAEVVADLVGELTQNLQNLDKLVKTRLVIVSRRNKRIRELGHANSVAQRTLSPGVRILGTQMAEWDRESKSAGFLFKNSEVQYELAQSIVTLVPQQKAAVRIDALHNNLLRTTTAHSAENIDVLIFPLKKSLKDLSKISKNLPKRAKRRMEKQLTKFNKLTVGLTSLPELRKQELSVIAQAEELLKINIRKSIFLSRKINFLVDASRMKMEEASSQSVIVQKLNSNILIAIVVLSLLSSFLIVWLYVGRNLIVRLTALSDSMLAIAAGDLHAPLPVPRGNDEITRMSEALTGFRDTAIEVEESNLRDVEEAQRRLVDAIENSSEGFAFYDPDDRLVICNNRYKELLYPNADIKIEPGIKFESIIRTAAEGGFIADAEGHMEEWVEERMARHQNPGDPRVQRRADGRWILITERKTGDGGTVAIILT
ncbi:MAG: PAS-domain containing protein [Sneathiella sp.]|nr:PAS-domain containing protein [Sneathiella sp.]